MKSLMLVAVMAASMFAVSFAQPAGGGLLDQLIGTGQLGELLQKLLTTDGVVANLLGGKGNPGLLGGLLGGLTPTLLGLLGDAGEKFGLLSLLLGKKGLLTDILKGILHPLLGEGSPLAGTLTDLLKSHQLGFTVGNLLDKIHLRTAILNILGNLNLEYLAKLLVDPSNI